MRGTFDPWRELRARAHVDLVEHDDDPDWGWVEWAETTRISLRSDLSQAERRSTLTHELVHIERGPHISTCPVMRAREEANIESEAARRLITVDMLARALQWTLNEHEAADELWVDVDMLRARLRSLNVEEYREIVAALSHHHDGSPDDAGVG